MNTTSTLIAAGKEIVCYCTRCKIDLAHMIISVVSGVPARVMCKTCKSEHNFKAKKGVNDPSAAPKPRKLVREKSAEQKVVSMEVEWMKQMNTSTKPLRPYAANESFAVGDKVAHPTFGEGIVQKTLYPNKVEIIFRTDLKILVHAAK